MSLKLKTLVIIFFTLLIGCGGGNKNSTIISAGTTEEQQVSSNQDPDVINQFTTGTDFIYKDDERFELKGVVYVVGEPGYLPWEVEVMPELPAILKARIDADLADIKALGANTIRFWGAPA